MHLPGVIKTYRALKSCVVDGRAVRAGAIVRAASPEEARSLEQEHGAVLSARPFGGWEQDDDTSEEMERTRRPAPNPSGPAKRETRTRTQRPARPAKEPDDKSEDAA